MKNPEFTFRYKIRNWPEYNRALVRRGQLTLWFDETSIAGWRDAARPNGPGRPMVYANAAIECAFVTDPADRWSTPTPPLSAPSS
jgi:hypothetical protein